MLWRTVSSVILVTPASAASDICWWCETSPRGTKAQTVRQFQQKGPELFLWFFPAPVLVWIALGAVSSATPFGALLSQSVKLGDG